MDKKTPTNATACQASISEGTQEPVMKKQFNFWTALGISVCTSGAWEGWAASLAQGIIGGGSVGLLWGWVFVSVGITCLAASLAEFASMWPSAGGQYVWARNLAPKKLARTASWFTAWISIAGLWLGALSCGMGVAVQIQSYVTSASNYIPKTWHCFLICLAVMICWIIVNIFFNKALHWINTIILVVHVLGYFIVIGVLTGRAKDKNTADYVFTDFENNTGWHSDIISWSVSLLTALYAFFSLDVAVHFSEEIPHADVVVPRALMIQVITSAITTFFFIIAILFCIGDTDAILNSPIGLMSPFTQLGINATGSVGVGIFLNCLSTSVAFSAGFGLWGASARALWAMARDGGVHHSIGHLNAKLNIPVTANLVLIPPSIVIYMIYIWNTTAFYGIMAGVLVSFQLSYLVPVGLNIFYARWKMTNPKGAFNLGRFGLAFNILGFLFSGYMIIFMSFPVYSTVTAANMNYACVIVGAVILFSIVTWFAYGSKGYHHSTEILAATEYRDSV